MREFYRARSILEDLLRKDLYGPVAEDEVISETWPDDYYICGRLFPQDTRIAEEEIERDLLDGDGGGYELPVALCYSNRPSSMAISFTVRAGTRRLCGEASFAWYVPEEPDQAAFSHNLYKNWRRRAKTVPFEINLDTGQPFQTTELHPGLELRTYLQKSYSDGARTLTVAMVNTLKRQMDRHSSCAATFFQPRIVIRGETEGKAVFAERKPLVNLNQDLELLSLEMLYRHNRVFATGHGCSAGWKSSGEYATEVYTEFLPAYELRQMEPACHIRPEILSFRFLGSSSAEEVRTGLEEMAESYEQWIVRMETRIDELPAGYRTVARANLANCRESLSRIRSGIDLLTGDEMVWQAFRLMNRAMLRQHGRRRGRKPESGTEPGWYPFQLAFILQEIPSVAVPEDPYRGVVDLLWFPTGGGKTEAYLGLAAFAIFLRRMRAVRQGRSGAGVAIIMRYTLRLLTLQQFERATALICACELIRREDPSLLGDAEIAAGLWVGGGLTPNRRNEATRLLEKIRSTGADSLSEEEPNPCQVLTCPWCGAEVRPQQYSVTPDDGMVIACPRKECPFNGRLPIYLVDEDIYARGPALIVSTIDKFARMTWQPEVGRLFGIGTDWQAPDLIIQDELHLISGPLGTVAGLYEIAVDEFCRNNGIRTKIISSTATIRNAGGQIRNLYGRSYRQFPAQGLDIRDSYFAREAAEDDRPTRRYLGILAPGTSGNTLLIRTYSVLLMALRHLEHQGFSKEVVDSFWTLTGYFNTLKELGGAVINILDDVHGRLKYLYQKKFNGLFSSGSYPPLYLKFDELTSRKKSSEIAEVLKRLEISWPSQDALDLILSSSMLSVGIDIGRLGLMVVHGQPKSNSEYIQATSRVGRKTPGLVAVIYDASRSRDRSHYEQFRAYHASLYRYVEATSLTPFSDRARDRALHAVLISLCRHLITGLRSNVDAGQIGLFRQEAESSIQRIVDRAAQIDSSEVEATRAQLTRILEHWERLARSVPRLLYQKYRNQSGSPLLTSRFDDDGNSFSTLNSMRDVDVECDVFLEG